MWLKGTFHLEIRNFLVLLALHNYIFYHLSHCGMPRQIRFSLHLSYYGEIQRQISPIASHQIIPLVNWRHLASFLVEDLLEHILNLENHSLSYFEVKIFSLTTALPFEGRSWDLSVLCRRYIEWTPHWQCCKEIPLSLKIQEQWCTMVHLCIRLGESCKTVPVLTSYIPFRATQKFSF